MKCLSCPVVRNSRPACHAIRELNNALPPLLAVGHTKAKRGPVICQDFCAFVWLGRHSQKSGDFPLDMQICKKKKNHPKVFFLNPFYGSSAQQKQSDINFCHLLWTHEDDLSPLDALLECSVPTVRYCVGTVSAVCTGTAR